MMKVGAAGGVSLADLLPDSSPVIYWALGLGLTAVGYLINMLIVYYARKYRQRQYVVQDYERNLYYIQYIDRISVLLNTLYEDIDLSHKQVFGYKYPIEKGKTAKELIDNLLLGIRPTYCKYVQNI
jgi:hypothetical protein